MDLRISLGWVAVACILLTGAPGWAGGLLDGRVFSGMIGPAEDPDLPDKLHFKNGHFWSDICTECGFLPGRYEAEQTAAGIAFTGTLESDTRGRFAYSGLVQPGGTIRVDIHWERHRWYWTTSRRIVFVGSPVTVTQPETLSKVRQRIDTLNPDTNPRCARF